METEWLILLPQLLRDGLGGEKRRRGQNQTKLFAWLGAAGGGPVGICLISARPQLSLSWFPQLQTKGSNALILGNGERRQAWIFPGAVNSGGKGALKSAERKLLASKLWMGKAHWWSGHRFGS